MRKKYKRKKDEKKLPTKCQENLAHNALRDFIHFIPISIQSQSFLKKMMI